MSRLLVDFYTSPSYDPKARSRADTVKAAIAFTITALTHPREEQNVIDLDRAFWDSLVKAASESNWIPPEYFVNDWVSDCADFLRNGPAHPREEIGEEDRAEMFATIIRAFSKHSGNEREWPTLAAKEIASHFPSPSSPPGEATKLAALAKRLRKFWSHGLAFQDEGGIWLACKEAAEAIESSLNRVSIADETLVRDALEPFANIGQWLFARLLPDDTSVVEIEGLNGVHGVLTRGHFKRAHEALAALSSTPTPQTDELPCPCVVYERYVPTCPEHGTPIDGEDIDNAR